MRIEQGDVRGAGRGGGAADCGGTRSSVAMSQVSGRSLSYDELEREHPRQDLEAGGGTVYTGEEQICLHWG